jgi:hypothetical protein
MDRIAHLVPCFVVDCKAVLFSAVLLDLRHDFLFAVAAHLPVTVLRPYIGALKVDFALVMPLRIRNIGIDCVSLKRAASIPNSEQYPVHPIIGLINNHVGFSASRAPLAGPAACCG